MMYESIFIVRPEVVEDKVKDLAERMLSFVKKKGGKPIETKVIGVRPLAYRIGKHSRGIYVQARYEGGGDAVSELERNLRISEDVIRFLTVRHEEPQEASRPKKESKRHGS